MTPFRPSHVEYIKALMLSLRNDPAIVKACAGDSRLEALMDVAAPVIENAVERALRHGIISGYTDAIEEGK